MLDFSKFSDLPFLPSPSKSEAPAKFLPLTPAVVSNIEVESIEDGNKSSFYLAHEKFHLDQVRHFPAISGAVWFVITAGLDTDNQEKTVEALKQGSQELAEIAPLLEGQAILFLLEEATWSQETRTKIIADSLLPQSLHCQGLELFFHHTGISTGSFNECLMQLKQEVEAAGLDFHSYITGFVNGLLEVAPFLDNKDFDPNMIFEGTGWVECGAQSWRKIKKVFSEPLNKEVVGEVKSLLKTARTRWNSAYQNNIIGRSVYPYVLSLMRQLDPYANYEIQFPTFFLTDDTLRVGNIPGRPLGTDSSVCHAIAWLYHAIAIKMLQARLGTVLKCPVYEIMDGRRANCCQHQPCQDLCCSENMNYVVFEKKMKECPFFWRIATSLYHLLETGGLKSHRQPVLDIFDALPNTWPKEKGSFNNN